MSKPLCLFICILVVWGSFSIRNHPDPGRESFISTSSPISRVRTNPTTPDDGKSIYAKQFASCHGDRGQGVAKHYPHPLRGVMSIEKLAKVIDETMPEDDPDSCVGPDALKVARFIHQEFYGGKNAAARIQLVRLTENQFRNRVADLAGSFRGQLTIDRVTLQDGRGLNASYYHSRNFQAKKRVKKRIDPTVDFDFGSSLPDVIPPAEKPGKKKNNLEFDPGEFSISWVGGLIAEKSGNYEFIVKSKNGFRLFVNNYRTPVINQWVTSGKGEYRVSLKLLGGRVYPLKLDFFRFKDKTSSIQLLWKPPHQSETVIPARMLVPKHVPRIALLKTNFPPDDSSEGYRRGTRVSQRWDEAVTLAAVEVADEMIPIAKLPSGNKRLNEAQADQLKQFCLQFVERAFGAPLDPAEKEFYVDQFFEGDLKAVDRLKRVVILALKSPRFLYANLADDASQSAPDYLIARRASTYLWDSFADQELSRLAGRKKLVDTQVFEQQLERMLLDVRAKQKIDGFFEYWLYDSENADVTKDLESFPGYTAQIAFDARQSFETFVDDVFWNGNSDFRQLFLADYYFLNPRLTGFYGGAKRSAAKTADPSESAARPEFLKTKMDASKHAGILTHPFLMTHLAYYRNTSPIHRGVFVATSLLGQTLPPPPNDVDPLSESFDPKMTTRERVEYQTKETACMSCHAVINPLGFSLENFDAVGRYRTEEKQKPINASVELELSDGKPIRIRGPRELARFLADSEAAQKSFIRHLFQHLVKQPVEAYGQNQLDQLHLFFVKNNYNMKKLVVEIVKVASLDRLNEPNETQQP